MKHFQLTPLIDSTDFNPNYFMVWSWAKNLGHIPKYFGQKLKHVCNNIEEAENYWESYVNRRHSLIFLPFMSL
ncbi:hypothetical protein [Rickettsia rhipicephali]|uniref:hypothetical protein n=1 Tax=Rickettsia rhipicephali TaxID=33992 RepID=UPI00225B14F5|nr:hypothetical protein [Rickettsia rhipicephali]